MRITTILLSISFVFLFLAGCSNGGSDPIAPSNDSQAILESSNQLLGYWTITINPDTLEASVEPDRSMAAHFNLNALIPRPVLTIHGLDPITRIMDVDVSVYNPYFLVAYDLRGIFFDTGYGFYLANGDGWTNLFDPSSGGPVNQFKAFAKEQPNRIFGPLSTHVENYQIYWPLTGGPISYAIEASYPSNCDEPYKLANFNQGNGLNQELGSSCHLTIDVWDWQDDISEVFIDASYITGETHTYFTHETGHTWGCTLTNNAGAVPGEYTYLITAKSSGSATVNTYEYADIEVIQRNGADWTFLVYMHESNLGTFALEDINEMEVAGSIDDEFNIIVLWDKEWVSPDVILRIQHDPDGYNSTIISTEVDDFNAVIPPSGLLEMGDGNTLEKFLRWGMETYPADHYGLDLWDHGDGPFSIVQQPAFVRSCCNGLQIWEIRDACAAVLAEHPETDKFDFIGFDACLMAWIETGYCLRNVTDVCLASEMTEPGAGWAYAAPMNYLRNNVGETNVEDFSITLINAYLGATGDGETLSAWRSEDLINIVEPQINIFATELMNALGSYRSDISACLSGSGLWGAYCWEYDVTDFGYFAEKIQNRSALPSSLRTAATNMINAIEDSMIMHGVNGSGTGCPYSESGWQIWFPTEYSDSWNASRRTDYNSLEFSGTLWDEFLAAYE